MAGWTVSSTTDPTRGSSFTNCSERHHTCLLKHSPGLAPNVSAVVAAPRDLVVSRGLGRPADRSGHQVACNTDRRLAKLGGADLVGNVHWASGVALARKAARITLTTQSISRSLAPTVVCRKRPEAWPGLQADRAHLDDRLNR